MTSIMECSADVSTALYGVRDLPKRYRGRGNHGSGRVPITLQRKDPDYFFKRSQRDIMSFLT